jgi:hypothetical protein
MSSPPSVQGAQRKLIRSAVILSGVAGFFWGAVMYELIAQNWMRAGTALFCACALTCTAYLMARQI